MTESQHNYTEIGGKQFDLPVDIQDYWKNRLHHDLYRLTNALAFGMFGDAKSAIDVGCFTSGLLVEMDWIPKRVATDILPYLASRWSHVQDVEFVQGDAFEIDFEDKFDLVISNQTIEHVEQPADFVNKLLALGRGLIISTTYETPAGKIEGHIQDPIDFEKFQSWFPCEFDSWLICYHPNRNVKHIVAVIKQSHPARKKA